MIEKSHLHNFNSRSVVAKRLDTEIKNNIKSDDINNGGSKFLNWITGLVNPLQNIPIISGIYASLNSGNPQSDRDLVQSSAGGFLFGGPVGAIFGFGNWIFEKIFDKTPTEIAFDALGVSNLWKNQKGENAKNLAVNDKLTDDVSIKNKNISNQGNVDKPINRAMSFSYPKWSPISNREEIKNKFNDLSLYKKNYEEPKRSISIDA